MTADHKIYAKNIFDDIKRRLRDTVDIRGCETDRLFARLRNEDRSTIYIKF